NRGLRLERFARMSNRGSHTLSRCTAEKTLQMSLEPNVQPQKVKRARRALRPTEPLEAHPYTREMFEWLAKSFIIPPAEEHLEELCLVFDLEADGLLESVTKIHCIVISAADSNRVHEYGPEQIDAALGHLSRADMLIGHNIQAYDLPALLKLHDWAPRPEW